MMIFQYRNPETNFYWKKHGLEQSNKNVQNHKCSDPNIIRNRFYFVTYVYALAK